MLSISRGFSCIAQTAPFFLARVGVKSDAADLILIELLEKVSHCQIGSLNDMHACMHECPVMPLNEATKVKNSSFSYLEIFFYAKRQNI